MRRIPPILSACGFGVGLGAGLVLGFGLGSCKPDAAPGTFKLVLRMPTPMKTAGEGAGAGEGKWMRAKPPGRVLDAVADGSVITLRVQRTGDGKPLQILAPGAFCPITIDPVEMKIDATVVRTVQAWFDFGPDRPQMGFDRPFTIEVTPGCPEARADTIAWTQSAGPPARDLAIAERGLQVVARTPTWRATLGEHPLPWGIVPISARTRGQLAFTATWKSPGGETFTHVVNVAAAARARGLPNISVGTRVYLSDDDWQVMDQPRPTSPTAASQVAQVAQDAQVAIEHDDGLASLHLPWPGTYRLRDGARRTLEIVAGRYDQVLLDCTRAGCHPQAILPTPATAMTTTWQRLLAGEHPTAETTDNRCAIACHTVGEPGLDDGGYEHTQRLLVAAGANLDSDLGRVGDTDQAWQHLPRALRRQAGVGCLACHGPAAIPAPEARWAVLRTDVCATCHDAPPRYGHVTAWNRTRMATADRHSSTDTNAPCVRCHTAWGFLQDAGMPSRKPPAHLNASGGKIGLTCAVCHQVHGEANVSRDEPRAGLLRVTTPPALLAPVSATMTAASGVCLSCHTPRVRDRVPFATAAAILLGRGGLDPGTGAAIPSPAPHLAVTKGCVGCHVGGGAPVDRGGNHTFKVDRKACKGCHPGDKAALQDTRARALALWQSKDEPVAPHATQAPLDLSTPRGRAEWNLLMVLEDRAADQHNGPFARLLLDSAEAVLGKGGGPGPGRSMEGGGTR